MINMQKSQEITDIVHSSIAYSGIEHAVISTPIYNRLHRILQSSLVYLTYPSNKVKRFEHSLGVMHLAGKIFFNSMCNSTPEVFSDLMNTISNELVNWRTSLDFNKYSFISAELRSKFRKEGILKAPVPMSSFYNKLHPGNLSDDYKFAYFVTLQAVRLAGLLHDVGHLPYSHILEHALKNMYITISKKETLSPLEQDFLNIMQRFADGQDEIHEEIGKLLIDNIRNSIIQNISDRTDPNLYFFLSAFDFAEKIVCSKCSDNTIFSDLHLITASVLDADRLDYCSRDALCAGTIKSAFPYDKLLATYELKRITDDSISRLYFCPAAKSLSSIEDLLKRRKEIFSEINFHHRVHKHEILLEEVICALGIEELSKKESIDPLSNPTLPLYVSSIWNLISKLNTSNDWPEYQIIQLDDSWLDTLLKHNFFEKYGTDYLSLRTNGNDILWNKFDELISATKRYHSLFKRASDFQEFDKLFFNNLKGNIDKLPKFLSNEIPKLNSYNEFYEKYQSFIFNYCIEATCITNTPKEHFFQNFEKELNRIVEQNNNLKINNCLLRSCMFSFGYNTAKTPLYLTFANKSPIRIEQISSQLNSFQKERAISPVFHVYYLPKYNTRNNTYEEINISDLLNTLVTALINVLINFSN